MAISIRSGRQFLQAAKIDADSASTGYEVCSELPQGPLLTEVMPLRLPAAPALRMSPSVREALFNVDGAELMYESLGEARVDGDPENS